MNVNIPYRSIPYQAAEQRCSRPESAGQVVDPWVLLEEIVPFTLLTF